MLALLAAVVVSQADPPSRPNIVVVITDDQGYGDLACHGNPVIRTPNLDALHAESVRLTDYHVSPTCSPTRAALLSGHWTNHTGAWHTIAGRSILFDDEVLLPQILEDAGYATAMFGKWHLGDNYPARPQDRGFAHTFIHGGGGVGQTPDYWDNAYFDGHYFRDGEPVAVSGHCTDVWFDAAEDYIREQAATGEPFFAYVSTNAPHSPMHSLPEYAAHYADQNVTTANFLGMIEHIDDRIGKLRSLLDELKIADDTIFLYTTDNGTAAGDKVFNAGMRAKKGSPYEGGHRVPAFWRWPNGQIGGGRDLDGLAAHVDILPTLLELTGVAVPDRVTPHGRSLAGALRGRSEIPDDRTIVTDSQRIQHPQKWRNSSVMRGGWRLINRDELYNLANDPGQTANIAADHPQTVAELQAAYDSWWSDLEPRFEKVAWLTLGDEAANPTRLTAHDWYAEGTQATPWNQRDIRKAKMASGPGQVWNVRFARPGTYRMSLSRWPAEAGTPLEDSLPPGEPVPGQAAFRTADGQAVDVAGTRAVVRIEGVGEFVGEVDASRPSAEVVVTIPKPIEAQLSATFRKGERLVNAFYVDVERVDGSNERTAADAKGNLWSDRPDVREAQRDRERLPVAAGKSPRTMRELRQALGDRESIGRAAVTPASGVRIAEAIPYVERESGPQLLDVYLPSSDGPHPVVVLVHGGGWRKGSRTNDRAKGIWLANHGYAAVAIDYRLGDAHPYPALMHDLQHAVAWVRSGRHDFALDGQRLILSGGSAGATMVALLAATVSDRSLRDTSLPDGVDLSVDGAVVIAGPTDTEDEFARRASFDSDSNYHVLLRGSIEDVPDKYRAFNPTRHASSSTPPMLFLDENSGRQSKSLRGRLEAAGVPYEHHVFEKVPHGSWNWTPWFEFTMTATAAFADRVWSERTE